MSQLPKIDAQVSALSVDQLLSFDSITVERNTELNSNATRFRLTDETLPVPLKERFADPKQMQAPPNFAAVEAILLEEQKEGNGGFFFLGKKHVLKIPYIKKPMY